MPGEADHLPLRPAEKRRRRQVNNAHASLPRDPSVRGKVYPGRRNHVQSNPLGKSVGRLSKSLELHAFR